jgi:hypothetical protein
LAALVVPELITNQAQQYRVVARVARAVFQLFLEILAVVAVVVLPKLEMSVEVAQLAQKAAVMVLEDFQEQR